MTQTENENPTAVEDLLSRGRSPAERVQHALHGNPALSPLIVLVLALIVFGIITPSFLRHIMCCLAILALRASAVSKYRTTPLKLARHLPPTRHFELTLPRAVNRTTPTSLIMFVLLVRS